jgi:lysophospholipase L1-like esterase
VLIRSLLVRGFAVFALVGGVAGAAPGAGLPATPVEAVRALKNTIAVWTDGQQHWVESWGAASQATAPLAVRDQTLRLVVRPRASGTKLRLRLANPFGASAVRIGAVTVGRRTAAAGVASVRAVTFGGHRAVILRAGESRRSDELAADVTAGKDLAISFYLAGPAALTSAHRLALADTYISDAGDHTDDPGAAAFARTIGSWPLLDEVSAWSTASGAIVALGDSITDGLGSTRGADRRWPDRLAERLGGRYSVVNAGISGNRVLTDRSGQSALRRFDRDVLTRPGVRYVVLLEGINDLGSDSRPGRAEEIIAGYEVLLSRAHDHGIRVVGGTLTPAKGAGQYSYQLEHERQLVNYWIRTSHQFDSVIDFDRAIRDPADAGRFRPAYECGDHLHPGDAGYRAMASAVDLELFTD